MKFLWFFKRSNTPRYEVGTKYLMPILGISVLFGVAPLTGRKRTAKRASVSSETNLKSAEHRISYKTYFLWIAHITINVLTINKKLESANANIKSNFPQCFEQNYCFRYVMFITQSVRPTFALTMIILKASKVSQFLERLKSLLKNQIFRTSIWYHLGKYLVYIFLALYSAVFWFYTEYKSLDQVVFYLNRILPFVLDFFIITTLTVIEKCFQNINVEIRELTKVFEKEKVKTLTLLHWTLVDLVEEVDLYFAMTILVGLVCTVVEVILILFYFIEANARSNVVIRNIIQDLVLLTRIIFLCKSGSDIVDQHNETLVQLERLNRKKGQLLNGSEQLTVRIFCARLKNRIAVISCGGYMNLNLRLITTIIGFVLMYWIVLIQLNDEHQKKHKPY